MPENSPDPEVRAAAATFRGNGFSVTIATSTITAFLAAVTTWLAKPEPPGPDWAKLDRSLEALRIEVSALREAVGQDRSRAITETAIQTERDRAQDARLARLER